MKQALKQTLHAASGEHRKATSRLVVGLDGTGYLSQSHCVVVKTTADLLSFHYFWRHQTGQSPLMLAVSRGRMEMVEICLEAGADINAADEVRELIFFWFIV